MNRDSAVGLLRFSKLGSVVTLAGEQGFFDTGRDLRGADA
jgi:hypothetical protein